MKRFTGKMKDRYLKLANYIEIAQLSLTKQRERIIMIILVI